MILSRSVIIEALNLFIYVINMLILARIILSFIIRDLSNPLLNFLYQITEPLLEPFRNLINRLGIDTGMFDFSPILALLFLDIVKSIIIRIL